MRNKFFAVFGVAATLILAACSSSSNEAKPAANGNTAAIVNAGTSSDPTNTKPNVDANGAGVPTAGDANLLAGETLEPGIQSPQMQNRLNKVKKGAEGGPAGPPVDVAALAMKMAKPAPDNSTFTSYLSDAGYEIRTFKSHPQLMKVERKTTDNGTVTIKVFLKSGKVVELPGTAIPILSSARAVDIMNAAGVSAPAAPGQSGQTKAKQ
jgi:hypothetical protein